MPRTLNLNEMQTSPHSSLEGERAELAKQFVLQFGKRPSRKMGEGLSALNARIKAALDSGNPAGLIRAPRGKYLLD